MLDLLSPLKPLTAEKSETDEKLKKCQPIDVAQSQFIEWSAAQDMHYFDLDTFSVVKRPPLAKLARELGFSRQSLYNWRKTIPEFDTQVNTAKQGLIQTNITAVWNAVFLRAMTGDVQAAEMFLSGFDPNYIPMKVKRQRTHNAPGISPHALTELLEKVKLYEVEEQEKLAMAQNDRGLDLQQRTDDQSVPDFM